MRPGFIEVNRRSLSNAGIILLLVVATVALFYPAFLQTDRTYKPSCQRNLKELGLVLIMYSRDNDGVLPSSAVVGSKSWNPKSYLRFATERGTVPVPEGIRADTWPMLLYPFMKNKDIVWCPNDPNDPNADPGFWRNTFGSKPAITPNTKVSYWYKAAIDRGWFGGTDANGHRWACRKESDFDLPADQIVFYEHASWHWGQAEAGLSNGVSLNCAFMDGHVQAKRLSDAGNAVGKSDPLAPGEPGWFNAWNKQGKTPEVGVNFDARQQYDNLP
jgi:prepilin-type processing-associated H-X9-DG protein